MLSGFTLFNLEGTVKRYFKECGSPIWANSSAGRAPALQAGGQRFDPANLHQKKRLTEVPWKQETSLSLLEIRSSKMYLEN